MKRGIIKIKAGFTLVEILTAIAVIGILLALLVPALTQVQEKAQNTRQKAQFHGIEVALEAVYNDMGDYPPSAWDGDSDGNPDYGNYAAPQRLAEALVGRDGFGLHPDTLWDELGQDGSGTDLYGATAIADSANQAARKGPYLELESANAVTLSNLYDSYTGLTDSYVLVDMYKIAKHKTTGKMTGSPILYYRADTSKIGHSSVPAEMTANIYSVWDSTGTVASNGFTVLLDPRGNTNDSHPLDTADGKELFYQQTANPNFTSPPRPYKADSFILHSAGPDGLYGTTDDVFNFES